MILTLPQDPAGWLPLVAPLALALVGLAHFLAPRLCLQVLGLQPVPGHPEAVGQSRSTFAGMMLAPGLCAILFDQPVLHVLVGLALAIAAAGKILHIVADGARGTGVAIRFGATAGLAALSLFLTPVREIEPMTVTGRGEALVLLVALATAAYGFALLAIPRRVLAWMRLAPLPSRPAAAGELRGTVAGCYLAVGLGAVAFATVFPQLVLGAGWLAVAFGRLISILSDQGNRIYNWAALCLELALGGLPLAVVFGMMS